MDDELIIIEIVKHLPGLHNQDRHAGTLGHGSDVGRVLGDVMAAPPLLSDVVRSAIKGTNSYVTAGRGRQDPDRRNFAFTFGERIPKQKVEAVVADLQDMLTNIANTEGISEPGAAHVGLSINADAYKVIDISLSNELHSYLQMQGSDSED